MIIVPQTRSVKRSRTARRCGTYAAPAWDCSPDLREGDRKLDWFVRYEGQSREHPAWSRAMGQIRWRNVPGRRPDRRHIV